MDAQMEIFWLGHASFKIKMFSGRIIYLDPYNIKDGEEKADIIISITLPVGITLLHNQLIL